MKHILFTLKGSPFELLDDKTKHQTTFIMQQKNPTTLLNLATHKFDPQGVTGVAMLAESHISIHTFNPEKGMAVCDVFTCGDTAEPEKAVEYMQEQLKANPKLFPINLNVLRMNIFVTCFSPKESAQVLTISTLLKCL